MLDFACFALVLTACFATKSFEHLLFDEYDDQRDADDNVYAHDNPKSPQLVFKGYARIHPPKRSYHSRCVHKQRKHGERLHDDVQVVGDD